MREEFISTVAGPYGSVSTGSPGGCLGCSVAALGFFGPAVPLAAPPEPVPQLRP